MSYRLVLHLAAVDEVRALPRPVRARVKAAIDGLAETPVPRGAARLRGRANAYRLRVGDYRIIYEVNVAEIVVYIVGVAHRKEVYRRLLRRR
jgi:mRNA interferase RelE/StbE